MQFIGDMYRQTTLKIQQPLFKRNTIAYQVLFALPLGIERPRKQHSFLVTFYCPYLNYNAMAAMASPAKNKVLIMNTVCRVAPVEDKISFDNINPIFFNIKRVQNSIRSICKRSILNTDNILLIGSKISATRNSLLISSYTYYIIEIIPIWQTFLTLYLKGNSSATIVNKHKAEKSSSQHSALHFTFTMRRFICLFRTPKN